jgi:hypothetical protein
LQTSAIPQYMLFSIIAASIQVSSGRRPNNAAESSPIDSISFGKAAMAIGSSSYNIIKE